MNDYLARQMREALAKAGIDMSLDSRNHFMESCDAPFSCKESCKEECKSGNK